MSNPPSVDASKDKQKKPRHRHSPAQLAALNELYEQNEHPPLDLRSSLAERLGMETKTVNAWFQNKRASSKRRTRGVSYEHPPINSSTTASTSHRHLSEFDDFYDDDYSPLNIKPSSRCTSIAPSDLPLSTFFTGNPEFLRDTDSMPGRLRVRPTAEQTEELRNLYSANPHPTTDQRQFLAERTGMRYQSITNWFQNQRNTARKRKDDDELDSVVVSTPVSIDNDRAPWTTSAFPPPASHPSLGPVSHPGYPSVFVPRLHRSPSVSPSLDGRLSRRTSSYHNANPYSNAATSFSRPRRSRPEPYQLDALKDLYIKTSTPSIEERSALALEIGMDVGKVTNWFRNLRQTARRRRKRTGSADDDEYDGFNHRLDSTYASRSGTPSLRSSASSSSMDLDVDDDYMNGIPSDVGSEDEYQEAVTPPPESLHTAPVTSTSTSSSSSRISVSQLSLSIDPASYAEWEKVSATQYSGVKIEDALLLLSFHHHIVH